MRFTFKKYLLHALIAILALYIATTTVKSYFHQSEPIRVIKPEEQISSSEFIISEAMVMSKLQSRSQIVSLQQDLHKKDTYVDDSWTGQRKTELTVNGTYKFGLNTKDIAIQHIDSENGIIYIKLGTPVLISLELPFDQLEFDKTQGFFRLAMDEEEQKKFYKAAEKNIEKELNSDKELLKQADRMNRDVVMDILNLIPEIKNVVFE